VHCAAMGQGVPDDCAYGRIHAGRVSAARHHCDGFSFFLISKNWQCQHFNRSLVSSSAF
jgi:hypothetical protein